MLQLSDVSVTFQDAMGKPFKALEIAHVGFEPGHITVVSGPSGSGKSTMLHVIAGLLAANQWGRHLAGKIRVQIG